MSQCCNIFSHLITSGFSKKKVNKPDPWSDRIPSLTFIHDFLACFDFLEKHSGGMKKERSKMKMVPLCNRKFTSLFAELEEFLRVRDYGFDSSQKLLKIWVFYFKQTQFTLKISNMTLPIEIYIFICMPFTLTSVEWISFNFHSSASPK